MVLKHSYPHSQASHRMRTRERARTSHDTPPWHAAFPHGAAHGTAPRRSRVAAAGRPAIAAAHTRPQPLDASRAAGSNAPLARPPPSPRLRPSSPPHSLGRRLRLSAASASAAVATTAARRWCHAAWTCLGCPGSALPTKTCTAQHTWATRTHEKASRQGRGIQGAVGRRVSGGKGSGGGA